MIDLKQDVDSVRAFVRWNVRGRWAIDRPARTIVSSLTNNC